jgi:hypothetical protein
MTENNPENLISINLKDFRNHFYQVLIPLLCVIAITYVIVRFAAVNLSVLFIQRYAFPIMAVLALMAFVHSAIQRKKLNRLETIQDFDEKAEAYKKVYRLRLNWYMISGFTCCFVFLFSARNLFLYFALFDALLLLQNYPNKRIFQRDLQVEDIIFY